MPRSKSNLESLLLFAFTHPVLQTRSLHLHPCLHPSACSSPPRSSICLFALCGDLWSVRDPPQCSTAPTMCLQHLPWDTGGESSSDRAEGYWRVSDMHPNLLMLVLHHTQACDNPLVVVHDEAEGKRQRDAAGQALERWGKGSSPGWWRQGAGLSRQGKSQATSHWWAGMSKSTWGSAYDRERVVRGVVQLVCVLLSYARTHIHAGAPSREPWHGAQCPLTISSP